MGGSRGTASSPADSGSPAAAGFRDADPSQANAGTALADFRWARVDAGSRDVERTRPDTSPTPIGPDVATQLARFMLAYTADPEIAQRRRRRAMAVAFATAVLVVVGFVGWRWWSGSDHQPATPTATVTRAQVGVPVDAPASGTYVDARLRADGVIVANQWFIGRFPVTSVELTKAVLPADAGLSVSPRLRRLSVAADGKPIRVDPGALRRDNRVVVALPATAKYVHIRYLVFDATKWSRPAPRGRALVFVNPLAVSAVGTVDPQIVRLAGQRVLGFECMRVARPTIPCGEAKGGAWVVTLEHSVAAAVQVVAQVNLG